MTSRQVAAIFLGACIASSLATSAGPARSKPKAAAPSPHLPLPQQTATNWGTLPLLFEPNVGQTDPQVRFLARAGGMTSFLTDRENVMVLTRSKSNLDLRIHRARSAEPPAVERTIVRMKLESARAPESFVGLEKTESVSNYFTGSDPSKWRPNVPNYRKVRAQGVYKGVDVVFYGNGRQLEYDFVVQPGADPGQIRLAYSGADGLTTDTEGNLLIATPIGTVLQRRPVVYQRVNGQRREVNAVYSIQRGAVMFEVANWDRSCELVIDPVFVYSTYLGGGGSDNANAIAVDSSGAVYLAGSTFSTDFPTTSGAYQRNVGGVGSGNALITKINAAGNALIYSTYLGGSFVDYAAGIAVDASGAAYVTGKTGNGNGFPTTPAAFQTTPGGFNDAFITKLAATGGSLVYSTFLGGSGDDDASGIAVNPAGEVYVTGMTRSTNFPTTAGASQRSFAGGSYDAFVTKLNAAGTAVLYSTYLGGSGSGIEGGRAIAVDASGIAYVTGYTENGPFPVTPGAYQTVRGGGADAFVTKVSSTGSLIYSTYLGGSGTENGLGIAVDPAGAAYVTGITLSSNFPTTPGAYQTTFGGGGDAFITKINQTGDALVYSTFLGGNGYDNGGAIALDSAGAAYITGQSSGNFNTCSVFGGGSYDAIAAKIDASGSTLVYATYVGGPGTETGSGIALDASGTAYITGGTNGNFAVTTGALQTNYGGGSQDAFVTKLNLVPPGPPTSVAVNGGSPQGAPVGTVFGANLNALLTDAGGNPVNGVTVTFGVPGSGASATLSATTAITDCSGIASVTATANTVAGTYAAIASVSGVGTSAKFDLTNTAGPAAKLIFTTQPADTPAGSPIVPVTVLVTDAFDNPVSGATLTMGLVTGGSLNGPTSQISDSSGKATFPNLSINTVGNYRMQASAVGAAPATSNPFNILGAAAQKITVAGGSGQSTAVGTAFATPLKALVQDAFNNPVAGASVTFAAPASGPSGAFGGSVTVVTDGNGFATSPILTANSQAGSFTATASLSTAGINPANFSLTNIAGAANKLVFIQQPSDAAAGDNITPAVTVQIEDAFGNKVGTAGISITLQLLPSGAVSGTPTRSTDATGLATFASINLTTVGQYQLLAAASGLSSATSNSFTIRANRANDLRITGGTPQSTLVLTLFARPLEGKVTDGFANPVSGETILFQPPTTGASATLSATSTTSDANGHFSVTATANNVTGPFFVAVRATSGGPVGLGYDLTNLTASPGTLSFPQQPSNTAAGATITPPVIVRFVDGSGAPVAGATITLSIVGSGATLNGVVTGVTDASGQVTYSDLSVNTAGTYNLLAVTGSISGISAPFTISSSTSAVQISPFQGSGQSAVVNTAYSGPLKGLVVDALGNPIAGAQVTFTAPSSGPAVTFAGSTTATTDASGIATAPAMTANSQTGAFQVSATTANAASPAIFNLTNISGATGNGSLIFVQQPTDTIAGQIVSPAVTVQLLDSAGNPQHTAGVPIAILPNIVLQRNRLFAGNATQPTDANGVATFSNLSIAQVGTYQLQASSTNFGSATSNPFNITAGTPSTILPTAGVLQSAIVLTVFGAPLQVTIFDTAGNPVAGVPVVFSAPSAAQSGTFGGQLTVTATTDAQGHASAVITANNIAGTYEVVASATAVTGSATFTLTNLPATARVLSFMQQPSSAASGQVIAPPVKVQLRDSNGQPVNAAGVAIVLSISSGTGTLLGSIVQLTDAAGLATFTDLRIADLGTKQLRSSSLGNAPAVSNPFEITAASAASITAIAGTPQSTNVSQPFPAALQARVLDNAGNPVSGATVTFALPPSGAGGTFSESATATTDSNGIATASSLTANATVGSFAVTASVTGVASPATFSLTTLPPAGALTAAPAQLNFTSQINQPAPPGQTIQVTSTSASALTWTAATLSPWITLSPSSGTTPGSVAVTVNPSGLAVGTYSGSIVFTSPSGGTTAVLVTYTITARPALVVVPPVLIFTASSNAVTPSQKTLVVTASSGTIAYRVTAQVSTPTGGNWLSVSSAQGQTPGNALVNVNPNGLSDGVYDGSVLFTPTDTTINSVAVPVTLVVGCGQGGCPQPRALGPEIISVVNGASFHPSGAPAAIMTIFGLRLSDKTYQATTYPLPTQLGPTSVTVNGIKVPLFYVSPVQINFQMPSTTQFGIPQVVVNSDVGTASSNGYPAPITAVDPGLFVTPDKRAASLNQDLSVHTAATPLAAGDLILLYMTGPGPLAPALPDGVAAPSSPLSLINGTTQVTIGGKGAQIVYAGEAPGFAGLLQINAVIPGGLPSGDQPLFVSINGVGSNAGVITVK